MVKKIKEIIENIKREKERMEFMATGFKTLDEGLDGGFLRKELIVIGAHTGIGKSNLASQLFYNIVKQGFKAAYFSLEISSEMIVSRMLGAITGIKPTRIQTGLLTPEEYERKIQAEAELETLNDLVFLYDDLYDLEEILKEIRENKYEFIIIDFIQNILSKGNDEYSRLTRTAIELQKIAKEVDGTVLALSQLSNSAAREGSKGKVLEYKGSGSIAIVCDLGFFIERENQDISLDIHEFTLNLRKNRRGSSGWKITLHFKKPGGKIYE